MCGLVGFWQPAGPVGRDSARIVEQMATQIAKRGPDDSGTWMDEAAGLVFGHRRLSIQDLSAAGHQPMASASQRFVMVYNGEIYNQHDLRAELEAAGAAPAWRGHSDTETLLAGVEAWGIAATLRKAVGMFAIALWDRHERTLTLARDRLGEKPLYYGWQGDTLLFGSELKALRVHPAFQGRIDRRALSQFLRHGYVPAPASIYEGIAKLMPGTLATFDANGRSPAMEAYWSLGEAVTAGRETPFQGSAADAADELDRCLRRAVSDQMLSDVPLGAFLSGGIDSSTIVALMQAQSSRPIKTFSIGFHEAGYNEAEHAAAVARHLGTDHTELYVTSAEAMAVIPKLPTIYDEPFADSSQIPTFLVSQLARRDVTVALSGDAGDELFGGYNRYLVAERLWNKVNRLPGWGRSALGSAIRALPASRWNAIGRHVTPLLPASLQFANIGDKAHKAAGLLHADGLPAIYRQLVSHWTAPAEIVVGGSEGAVAGGIDLWDSQPIEAMMALDALTYLPDDILVKVDRAAMGVSLETRVPFLDHRVVEFAWRLPFDYKVVGGTGKQVLRDVLYRYVPRKMIERPKMGFGVPIDSWLRGPLRDWAEDLLDEGRLRREGYFNPAPIREKWREHLNGTNDWHYLLWNVLMFQAWRGETPESMAIAA